MAVDNDSNVRSLNVKADPDEVVRRVPLTFTGDGKVVPALAVELAARALAAKPQLGPGQSMTIAGYRVPSVVPNTLTVNFEGGSQDIPTYSLADLRACIEAGNNEFFHRHFAGKVVIIGVVLEAEEPPDHLKTFRHRAGDSNGRTVRPASARADALHLPRHRRPLHPCDRRQQPDTSQRAD